MKRGGQRRRNANLKPAYRQSPRSHINHQSYIFRTYDHIILAYAQAAVLQQLDNRLILALIASPRQTIAFRRRPFCTSLADKLIQQYQTYGHFRHSQS
jgi:hypothetical protein